MKIILIFVLIVFTGLLTAQNVLQQFMYSDSLRLKTPLYLPDGKTPNWTSVRKYDIGTGYQKMGRLERY